MIAAIQARHQQGSPLSHVWKEDRGLFSAARRRFGNWQNALAAAGLESKPRRSWSEERVLQELRAWHHLPTCSIWTADATLAGAARSVFGGWRRALVAAGIVSEATPAAHKRKWDRQRVIAGIQSRRQEGKPMRYKAVHRDNDPLVCAARRYFGSWVNAMTAAGLSPERRRQRRRAE